MCDKIDDEYIDFLENYLSDVLTGQMYADVDTVSIEKYLTEMKDSTTGKELLSQANCADLLSDEAKEIIDERLQKSNCDTHELIIRLRYCLQMTLKRILRLSLPCIRKFLICVHKMPSNLIITDFIQFFCIKCILVFRK